MKIIKHLEINAVGNLERDGGSWIPNDVDDVLAVRVLNVLTVDFQEPVAGQKSRIQLLVRVASHRLGENHRPLDRIPEINKQTKTDISLNDYIRRAGGGGGGGNQWGKRGRARH